MISGKLKRQAVLKEKFMKDINYAKSLMKISGEMEAVFVDTPKPSTEPTPILAKAQDLPAGDTEWRQCLWITPSQVQNQQPP